MQHYFLLELTPLKKENAFDPVMLAQSQDFQLITLALHHYGNNSPDHQSVAPMLVLYSVESTSFNPGILTSIGANGKPRPGANIEVLAVSSAGQSIFFDKDLEEGFVIMIDNFQHLPRAVISSQEDRQHWQQRLGPNPTGTDEQLITIATAPGSPHIPASNAEGPVLPAVASSTEETYFPAPLRVWITTLLASEPTATDAQIVRQLTGAGIDLDIATALVEAERKDCLQSAEKHTINFEWYEPIDDRLFTASDMRDFALEATQTFMNAAFSGHYTINGTSLEQYIETKLDSHQGDASHSTWIPKSQWPRPREATPVSQNVGRERIPIDKKQGGGKGI